MIDPGRTRADLLAEIGATDLLEQPASYVTDPRDAISDPHIRVSGHESRHLFSLVKAVLLEAFAEVSREDLVRDLLIPLRNALGNAAKHGNAHNPEKSIVVDLILTSKGTLVIVTDEGDGFDVALTFRRFQEGEIYYRNEGAGFRNLHRAKSIVSFDTNGRALLLCYRPRLGRRQREVEGAGRAATSRKAAGSVAQSPAFRHSAHADSTVLDPGWMLSALSADLGDLGSAGSRIVSCRIYAHAGRSDDGCGARYAICLEDNDGRRGDVRVLTGRLHLTEAAAAIDFEICTRLHNAAVLKKVRAPKPVARLSAEPRLVLFQFDPWLNLAEFVSHRAGLRTFEKVSTIVGRALAGLHNSQVHGPSAGQVPLPVALRMTIAGAEKVVDAQRLRPDVARCFSQAASDLQAGVALIPARSTPIHGALGWNCIHYGADGQFYFSRFENCRRCDPGLDLGGFAADLLCLLLARGEEPLYRPILNIFITTYNAEATQPIDENSLRFHIVLALIDRLGHSDSGALFDRRHLLAALNVASRGW